MVFSHACINSSTCPFGIVRDVRTRWQILYSSADNLDKATPSKIELETVQLLI